MGWLQPWVASLVSSQHHSYVGHCEHTGWPHWGPRKPGTVRSGQGPICHRSHFTRMWRPGCLAWEFCFLPLRPTHSICPYSEPLPVTRSEPHGLFWTLTKAVCVVSRISFTSQASTLLLPTTYSTLHKNISPLCTSRDLPLSLIPPFLIKDSGSL